MPSTIPLTPKTGDGLCIADSALQTADCILSTTREAISRAIRLASGSDVSRAMIYAGSGEVIEAIGERGFAEGCCKWIYQSG